MGSSSTVIVWYPQMTIDRVAETVLNGLDLCGFGHYKGIAPPARGDRVSFTQTRDDIAGVTSYGPFAHMGSGVDMYADFDELQIDGQAITRLRMITDNRALGRICPDPNSAMVIQEAAMIQLFEETRPRFGRLMSGDSLGPRMLGIPSPKEAERVEAMRVLRDDVPFLDLASVMPASMLARCPALEEWLPRYAAGRSVRLIRLKDGGVFFSFNEVFARGSVGEGPEALVRDLKLDFRAAL